MVDTLFPGQVLSALAEGRGEGIKEQPFTPRPGFSKGMPGSEGESQASKGPRPFAGEEGSDYVLELLEDTLAQLEPALRGTFLQKLLKRLAGVDVSETESLTHWSEVLRRRSEMAERLGRPVSLKTAATDYFDAAQLLQKSILLDHGELKQLRRNAATDPLTGLYNRRLFDEYLTKELNRSRRYAYPLALLLFDLRNFKQANDTYGHAVGDEVLRSLARAFVETIRGSDYPCRIGGDEFALLLPQSEKSSAFALAQRITEKFELYAQALAPNPGLGLDYGVTSFPDDGESAATLYEVADRQLYAHKKSARRVPAEPQIPAQPQVEVDLGREPVVVPPPPALRVTGEPVPLATPVVSEARNQRRYERISLEGSGAYAVLRSNAGTKVVRVLDMSFGGFSFLLDEAFELPETFHARLHVPIMPTAELRIRRVYAQRLAQGLQRIGCAFFR